MPDPAAVERSVLAAVALSDRWLSAKTLSRSLRLTDEELLTALRDLVRSGDLDWDGVVPGEIECAPGLSAVHYHLPLREVSRRRRMARVS